MGRKATKMDEKSVAEREAARERRAQRKLQKEQEEIAAAKAEAKRQRAAARKKAKQEAEAKRQRAAANELSDAWNKKQSPTELNDQGEIEFTVTLKSEVYIPLLRFLKERGLSGKEFIQLCLRSMLNKGGFYTLQDQLRFGKYYGERLETVIRADPEYIDWCSTNLKNFNMDNKAFDLLGALRPDLLREYQKDRGEPLGGYDGCSD